MHESLDAWRKMAKKDYDVWFAQDPLQCPDCWRSTTLTSSWSCDMEHLQYHAPQLWHYTLNYGGGCEDSELLLVPRHTGVD